MHCVIALNAAIILVELRFEYKPTADEAGQAGFTVTWWEVLELGFTLIYNCEMLLKMLVHGVSRYWKTWRNRFDGSISLGSLAAEVILIVPWVYNDPALIRFIMFVRLLRILRVLNDINEFHNIFAAFFQLVPAFSRLVAVLFLITVLFGQIGIPLFGGKIYEGAPQLNGTSFAASNYFANNFNDCGSAMVTLFELLVRAADPCLLLLHPSLSLLCAYYA